MIKSNVIEVDFRPCVRHANVDELGAQLDVIDTALAAAHASARALQAELRASGEALEQCEPATWRAWGRDKKSAYLTRTDTAQAPAPDGATSPEGAQRK